MTTAAKPLTEIAAQWREARMLYSIYSALLERFALGVPPCRELESPIDRNEPEALQRVDEWFEQMDQRVHVHQMRQLLQTSKLGTEENLRALISHHLEKENKNEADRDKIDFLLVQYLSSCAPPGFYEKDVSFEEIAQVLDPVLGEVGTHPPNWLEPLEKGTNDLESLRSLRELLEQGTLEQMRILKAGAGEMYFGPTALVAITRFNFLVRRTFVRLIAADLHAIRFTLHELQQRGVKTVDCTRAGLSTLETIEDLRQICHEWKRPFRAAYAAGQNFKELIEIRTAVEEALSRSPQTGAASAGAPSAESDATGSNGIPPWQATPMEESKGSSEASVPQPETSRASSISTPSVPVSAPITPVPVTAARATGSGTNPDLMTAAQSAAPKTPTPPPMAAPSVPTPMSALAAPSADALLNAAPSADLKTVMDEIAAELGKANLKEGAVANVVVRGVKLMLASWEVAAFLKGRDETADTLQRTVASRGLLLSQVERRKRGEASLDLRAALKTAQLEAAKIQARIAVAKQAKDIDSAVNLAATSKRLLALLEEADKLAK